jgi:hypothetical protein
MTEGEEELPDLLPARKKERSLAFRVLCIVGAIVLFVLGIVFWLVPVITGIPFYIAAAVLLAVASERARGWVNSLERKLPRGFRIKLRRGMRKIPIRSIQDMAASTPAREEQKEKVPSGG